MNLVDSSGWLEYLADGPNAVAFATPLAETSKLAVSTINIYEVFKVVLRERGEDAALQAIALMQQSQIIDVTSDIALRAAKISLENKLPMADSLIFATAQAQGATLWTQDNDLEGLPQVKYFRSKKR